MKTNKKGNFEFVKDSEDSKTNYIFQNNKITKTGFWIILTILVVLIGMVLYFGLPMLTN